MVARQDAHTGVIGIAVGTPAVAVFVVVEPVDGEDAGFEESAARDTGVSNMAVAVHKEGVICVDFGGGYV